MAQRAYWEQTNRHGQVDRLELHDAQYTGTSPELQFKGDKTGFTRQWDEVTSESNDKLINVQANRIQIGKYDFRPRIENATGFQILEDIRDSDNKRFYIVHKIDGTFEWAGWVTTRIFSYPEKSNNFFAHIRATDFEILEGIDYPLTDTRQTFIDTFASLFSELPTNVPIKTATSWVEQNVTARVGNETYDFLDEVRHETKALREFGRTGDETDQPITKWEALEHVAEPGLLIRQMGGHVMIDQLTDLADPTTVNETTYDSAGTVTTATASVDRRQTGYTTTDNGTPTIKVSSDNDTYPAIKRARNKYDHRTNISEIAFAENIDLSGQAQTSQSQLFLSDGTQQIRISFDSRCVIEDNNTTAESRYRIQAGAYYLQDDGSWSTSTNTVEDSMNKIKPVGTNNSDFRNSVSLTTDTIPAAADGTLEVTVLYHIGDFSAVADPSSDTVSEYTYFSFEIVNPIAQKNSTSINYQLTQDNFDAPVILNLDDTWFGDGPLAYSVGALRHGPNDGDNITDTWRRRGQTIAYRNYHQNLLKEVIDLGRTNMRKLEADIWGAYDPTKVLNYNGSYFYFAGGKYDGTTGKWRVTLMELNLQTGSDTFEDIPKFTDETGSGTGSTSSGGGGGLDQSTADARYLEESLNLSDLDSASAAISNLGITATASELNRLDGTLATVRSNLGLANQTANLDLNSLAINGDDLFSLFYTEQEINSFFNLYYSKADLTDGTTDLDLAALTATTATFSGLTTHQGGIDVAESGVQGTIRFGGDGDFIIERPNSNTRARVRTPLTNDLMSWRMDSNRVGINNPTPTEALDVSGNGRFSGDLFVEGGLFAQEFVVEQTRQLSEFRMSPTGGKIESVSGSAGSETITFSDEFGAGNPVSVGTILLIQSRTGQNSGTIVKRLYRKVESISGMDATLSTTGITWSTTNDVGSIASGDHAVGVGHVSDATLDHYIHYDIANIDIPAIRFWDSVSDVNGGTEFMRLGGLDSFQTFGSQDIGIGIGTAHYLQANADSGSGSVSLSNGIFTADGSGITAAGWDITSQSIEKRINSNTYSLSMMSDTARWSGSSQGGMALLLNNSQNAGNLYITLGEVWESGFLAEDGISVYDDAIDKSYFKVSKERGSDVINARLAGSYFDATDLWGYPSGYSGSTSDKSNASVRLDFANGRFLSQSSGGTTTITEASLTHEKTTGAGNILMDALDPTGSRIDINGDSYKVARFQEGSVPQIGVPQEYTGSTGGSANSLPSQPVSYIPIEVPNSNTGSVNTYVIPVYSPASTPDTPTNVTLCSASNPDGIRISWDNMNVDSYEVERAESSSGPWTLIGTTTTTSFLDDQLPPLNPNTTYYYRVRSVENGLTSGWSTVKSGSYNSLGACA